MNCPYCAAITTKERGRNQTGLCDILLSSLLLYFQRTEIPPLSTPWNFLPICLTVHLGRLEDILNLRDVAELCAGARLAFTHEPCEMGKHGLPH